MPSDAAMGIACTQPILQAKDRRENSPTGKSPKSCRARFVKIFPFSFDPNHLHIPAVPSPRGAARDRYERGTGCGGRGDIARRARLARTAKSCGPDAPMLASSRAKCFSRGDGGNQAGHRGELEGNRKTIAQGMPDESGEPVVTTSCFFARNHGCIEHPAFPAPSLEGRMRPLFLKGGTSIAKLGRIRPRDRETVLARLLRCLRG